MGINEAAARGFELEADAYDRGRPTYPEPAVAWLAGALGIGPGTTVVDLGAGTGKLTRLLAPLGAALTAVEPVAAMRARLVAALPAVRALDGTAESMPLPDGSVDAVTAAQAFHWFDDERALAEIQRVLRPGGRLGLVWNVRDESPGWPAELSAIIETHAGDTPRHRHGRWRDVFAATTLFGPLHQHSFEHVQEGDRSMVLDRVGSISFVAALAPAARQQVLAEVGGLLDRHPELRGRSTFALPYRTDVYWTERRPTVPDQWAVSGPGGRAPRAGGPPR